MAKSYPWAEIKHAYVTSQATYAEIANKYGPSESQLRKRAAVEKWVDERNKFRMAAEQKTTAKTIERVSDERSEINTRHYRIWGLVIEKLERALSTALEIDEIETLTRALDRAHKGQRLAKEMDKKDEGPADDAPEWARQIFGAGGVVQPSPVRAPQGPEGDSPEPEPV